MRIAVIGNGRMGRMIESVCAQEDVQLAGFVGPQSYAHLDDMKEIDAVVDFSYPGNLNMILESAVRRKLPLVIGTTGLTVEQSDAICAASDFIPIVRASNFSAGVTVLIRLARMTSQMLREFDIEIAEIHHNQKEDAPSGTAQMLLSAVDPEGACAVVNGRKGRTGKRGREIGVHALRGGTAAGEHSVYFLGPMEEIELRHRADSREIFARGALQAVRFAVHARPGLYDMEDVLFGGK